MKNWKIWLPDVVAVVVFAVIAFAYFYPADVENRILFRHDSSAGLGAGQEASEYLHRTGEVTRWSNAIFSGKHNNCHHIGQPNLPILHKLINTYLRCKGSAN